MYDFPIDDFPTIKTGISYLTSCKIVCNVSLPIFAFSFLDFSISDLSIAIIYFLIISFSQLSFNSPISSIEDIHSSSKHSIFITAPCFLDALITA